MGKERGSGKGFGIGIICVGNQKEKWMRDITSSILNGANSEFRSGSWVKAVESIELPEESLPKGYKDALADRIRAIEGERILQKIRDTDFVVALDINGDKMSIDKTIAIVNKAKDRGFQRLVFVIGGSIGLHSSVLKLAKERISFSALTYPHQIARLIISQHILEVASYEG